MMNMVITDNELDNVNGDVAKSLNSYSIQHALARNVQGTPNIATKKAVQKPEELLEVLKIRSCPAQDLV